MIKGFSKLSKEEKRQYIVKNFLTEDSIELFKSVAVENNQIEQLIDGLSENVISSYFFPYSISPNFKIDGKEYIVPMVTEESSVVAAASKSAGFWFNRGGFKTEVIGTIKIGQVHFKFDGDKTKLEDFFSSQKDSFFRAVRHIDEKMLKRGGGIQHIELIDKTNELDQLFQLEVGFDTCDAMGANYMNSCLEGIAASLKEQSDIAYDKLNGQVEIIMSILSNYSPNNAVNVCVECPIEQLDDGKIGMSAERFATKFTEAVQIAEVDVYRAVTHNKGFYNGVDAVALATGNDWRAIEANGHAFAASEGRYKSLSKAKLSEGIFRFEATLPLQVGTVGGIVNIHPLAKISKEILGNPAAVELMKIMASVGLASNFAAVKSLVTTGIQKGHMKMHLNNILTEFNATQDEAERVKLHFEHETVSHSGVYNYIQHLREKK